MAKPISDNLELKYLFKLQEKDEEIQKQTQKLFELERYKRLYEGNQKNSTDNIQTIQSPNAKWLVQKPNSQ